MRSPTTVARLSMALLVVGLLVVPTAVAQQGKLTSDGPVTLDLTGEGATEGITVFGERVECPETTYAGHKHGVTPHQLIPSGSTSFTVTPAYVNCATTSEFPPDSTMATNGCDFVFHIGTTVSENEFSVSVEVICPSGKAIELREYNGAGHSTLLCRVLIGSQVGITGLRAISYPASDDIEFLGTLKGIHLERQGFCSAATSTAGEYHMDLTAEGTNSLGELTGITLTD